MRFNKAELAALATNPKTKFEREGLLLFAERQESFFRRADVNCPHWCKLRGNLLFYLKDHDPHSPPLGLFVLENCRPLIRNDEADIDGFVFILEFEGSFSQRMTARSAKERLDWVKSIQLASYAYLNQQISYLNRQIANVMGNRIQTGEASLCRMANEATLLNATKTKAMTSSSAATLLPTTAATTKADNNLDEGDLIQF